MSRQVDESELVSVVVPCYNAEGFLSQTIESILDQSYGNLEVLVVDDRSTDNSVKVASSYAARDKRVAVFEMERNAGAPAMPRNIGVRRAKGKWIAFLDSDDIWHPRKIEYQMQVIRQTSARLCSTEMRDFQTGEVMDNSEPGDVKVKKISLRTQLIKYRTPTSSIVVDRELMIINAFNEDLSFKAREDTDCFIRMHELIPFSVKLGFPFVYYRHQRAQISGNKLKMVRSHLNMLRKYRMQSGKGLGLMAYVYTATHFVVSVYVRGIRRRL